MLSCSCSCDYGDSEGLFDSTDTDKEPGYHTCTECGETIWPWELHQVGYWWDCGACDDFSEAIYPPGKSCDGMDDDCDRDDTDGHACDRCELYGEPESCEDAGDSGWCIRGREADSVSHMCKPCAAAAAQLLCGCWYVGSVWESIAYENEMTVAECIGGGKP